jgi:transposase InsO family protein
MILLSSAAMEAELIGHLLMLLDVYRAHREREESTVGRLCAADGDFFQRLRDGKTLTVRKYDTVVGWFSENWPEGAEWPAAVRRPIAEAAE